MNPTVELIIMYISRYTLLKLRLNFLEKIYITGFVFLDLDLEMLSHTHQHGLIALFQQWR